VHVLEDGEHRIEHFGGFFEEDAGSDTCFDREDR